VCGGSNARQYDSEQIEEYVKNGAQLKLKCCMHFAKVTSIAELAGCKHETR
jgi:hypothetical protein